MKNKEKKVLKYLMILSILVLTMMITQTVFADVGNSYSDSNSSSSHSSGGGNNIVIRIIYLFLFAIPFPINIILIIGVIVGVVWVKKSKFKDVSTADLIEKVKELYNGFSGKTAMDINEIKEDDPDFSERAFMAFVKDVFISVQNAWTEKEWSKVRPFESNELFEVHNRQLQEYIDNGETNHLEKQEIKSVTVENFGEDGGFEYIVVRLNASLVDYTLDEEGNLISGNKTLRYNRTYSLEFKRVAGVKTVKQEGNSTTNCPNCGAPTEITSSGKCEYCKFCNNKWGLWLGIKRL